MGGVNLDFPFPYLSVDLDQATMVILSAAQQTVFFEQIGKNVGFWGDLAGACGMIGFVILIFGGLFRKVEPIHMLAWAVVMLITLTLPSFWKPNANTDSQGVFFSTMTPAGYDWANSPYSILPGGPPIPGGRKPLDDIQQSSVVPDSSIRIFTPQLVAIDVLNRVRAGLALSFDGAADAGLNSKLAGIQMLRRSQVTDYRPHFDMTIFQGICAPKVSGLGDTTWMTTDEIKATNPRLLDDLEKATFTVGDLIQAHQIYWHEVDRTKTFQRDAQCDDGNGKLACTGTTGLPPLGKLTDATPANALTKGQFKAKLSTANKTILINSFRTNSSFEEFLTKNANRRRDFDAFLKQLGGLENDFPAQARNTPVELVFANVNDAGQVQFDSKFLGLDDDETPNCRKLLDRTVKSFEKARDEQLELTEDVAATLDKFVPKKEGRTAADIPAQLKPVLAYEAILGHLKNRTCSDAKAARAANLGPGAPSDCTRRLQEEASKLKNFMLGAMMTNAQADVDAVIARSARTDGSYVSPIREFASKFGEKFSPVAVFFKGLFGGFEAGTYSAIMPMLISYFLALIIMCTPLLMLPALMIPQWAPGILAFSVIGVAYLKMVEISFVLVKGVFTVFLDLTEKSSGLLPAHLSSFHDIILGMGYTAAFIISLVIMFGLRDPGQLIQKVAGQADKTAQISTQEAMAMGAAIAGGAKLAGSFLLPGGAGLKALGSMAGSMQSNVGAGESNENYFSGLANTFNEGRRSALNLSAARQGAVEDLRNMPPEGEQERAARARARAFSEVEKRGLEEAKGLGVPGGARNGREIVDPASGNLAPRKIDPAVTVVAESLGKETPTRLKENYTTASQLFASGALSMRNDHKGVSRIQVDMSHQVMQKLSPELQKAISQLQSGGKVSTYQGPNNQSFLGIKE